ncbi:hypothetical protein CAUPRSCDRAFT_11476 [Caulochytrium protostelioides]|uniref:Endonuclease/exonuclease/phosphatase domain-containing protein n=1 Tax=Caulochytrium protostelioides TaxID=1555241 RepID=A0A4P9WX79_9FUNG|nr:hypothetical protein CAUPRSCDRAFT_11476 [Caulochytrium protostelioides]
MVLASTAAAAVRRQTLGAGAWNLAAEAAARGETHGIGDATATGAARVDRRVYQYATICGGYDARLREIITEAAGCLPPAVKHGFVPATGAHARRSASASASSAASAAALSPAAVATHEIPEAHEAEIDPHDVKAAGEAETGARPSLEQTPSAFAFTLLTYNVLSQTLVKRDWFPYAGKLELKGKYRMQRLREQLVDELMPYDLATLQEGDNFTKNYRPWLTQLGYHYRYLPKNPERIDARTHGRLTYWNPAKFRLGRYQTIAFDQSPLATPTAIDPDTRNVAQGLAFELVASAYPASRTPRRGMVVTNQHLFRKPSIPSSHIQAGTQVLNPPSSPPAPWLAQLAQLPLTTGRTVKFQPESARAAATVRAQKRLNKAPWTPLSLLYGGNVEPVIKEACDPKVLVGGIVQEVLQPLNAQAGTVVQCFAVIVEQRPGHALSEVAALLTPAGVDVCVWIHPHKDSRAAARVSPQLHQARVLATAIPEGLVAVLIHLTADGMGPDVDERVGAPR